MKIGFLIDEYAHPRAGTEHQLELLARGLAARGHEIELGVLRASPYTESGAFPAPVSVLGITKIAAPGSWLKLFAWGRRLRREGFELVQIYFNDAAVLGPMPLRLAGLKVVVCRRDMGFWYTRGTLALLRASAWAVDALVANSRAAGEAAAAAEWIAPAKLEVIYNGLEARAVRAAAAVPAAVGPRIGIVANVRPIKRIADLVRALPIVLERVPDAELAIVGGGDTGALEALAAELGVGERVRFAGSTETPEAWIETFDVGALCSESEGLSNAILEYMALGKPVVATRTGGNPELVGHGETGRLYPVGDVEALAEALTALLVEPARAREMGAKGAALVAERFSLERMIERELALFERLLERRSAGTRALRVLHVIDSGGLYGAERLILMLARAHLHAGHEVSVATLVAPEDDGDPLGEAARRAGIPARAFLMRDGLNLRGIRAVLAFARGEHVDVIHSHGYRANILLGLVPRRSRPKVIATLHGWTSGRRGFSRMRLYEIIGRRLLRRLDAVVAVTATMLEDAGLAHLGPRLTLIPNGIELDTAVAAPSPDDEVLAFIRGHRAIVCIGRLSDEKGIDLLVAALPRVLETIGSLRLVLIGTGPEAGRLAAEARSLGVADRILFAGFRDNARAYLPFFDALVLPSRTEGLPLVMLEAMAAGTPVVATPVGGIPDALEDGADGVLLARAGDAGAIADGLTRLLSQPTWGERLAAAGRRRVEQAFSAASCARSYESLYRKLAWA